MISQSLDDSQTKPLRPKVPRLAVVLGLATIMVPGLSRAQAALPFTDLVFIERGIIGGSETNGNALCDQYFGHNALTGGGLFLLKNFQSASPEKVDIVAGLTVPAGKTNAGQKLSSGTFLSPDLSYDGKTLVFAWSSGGTEKWTAQNRFHFFKVDLDGKNLVQLTDGDFDDIHPAWMPSGRIVFVSTRRGGFVPDHTRPVPTYTLHSMKADGTDIIRLSHHVANDFHPSIANDGRIIYTRWDNIDRDSLAAHHIWFCNPDGSNPRSWGGNYALPLDTMTGSGPWTDGRKDGKRPMAEFCPRSIPGSGPKFVAVAGPHHGEAYGTLIVRDFSKMDDNQMGQVTKITPEVGLPETAENGTLTYGPAWPVSETLFLTSHDNSLVLLDTSVTPGKLTEYYRSGKSGLRPINPIPAAPRTAPPIVFETAFQGERWTPSTPPATIKVYSVYETDTYGTLPAGVKITAMRIVQVLPKTTTMPNDPRIGFSSRNFAKLSLGTVPVEEDGSVFFEAPIGREILFQLLDEKGMAVQTMRSGTYLHPGEEASCVGCHEDKLRVHTTATPLASRRPASKMEPELGRVEPINYARHVSPVLTSKCLPCHQDSPAAPTLTARYADLYDYAFWFAGDSNGSLQAVHGGSRSKPGMIGARGSRMGKALLNATHQKAQSEGAYTADDVRTLTQWLDLGSDELGSCDNPEAQRQGELVWPSLDFDKDDPQGLSYEPEGPAKDAGVSGPDLPAADVPQADAPLAAADGAAAGGGTSGTTGSVASGGQSGSGGIGGIGGAGGIGGIDGAGGIGSAGDAGDASPADTASTAGSGGQSGSGGAIDAQGTVASGGQSGSGSQNQGRLGSARGCRCSMGASLGGPASLWILLIMGIALLGRRAAERLSLLPCRRARQPGLPVSRQ